jgi:ketosteroid isomerase-like protein
MKTTTTTPALPAAVTRYLEAANRFDALVAADCFTADATVHDENQEFVGRDAIRAWVAETSRKYRPVFTVMRATVNAAAVSLSVAVSGQFPGSPVTLDYRLRFRDGKIVTLTIE